MSDSCAIMYTCDENKRIVDILNNHFINTTGNTWQEKLDSLVQCKCCERHQLNKPTTMALWVDIELHGTQHTPCKCKCRHIARFICRQFDDEGQMLECPVCI